MISDVDIQEKQTLSFPSCFWTWCLITTIATLRQGKMYCHTRLPRNQVLEAPAWSTHSFESHSRDRGIGTTTPESCQGKGCGRPCKRDFMSHAGKWRPPWVNSLSKQNRGSSTGRQDGFISNSFFLAVSREKFKITSYKNIENYISRLFKKQNESWHSVYYFQQ